MFDDLQALSRLHRLAMLSLRAAGLESILSEIVDIAIDIAGADFGNVQIIDPASSDLRIVAQRGFQDWWIEFWNVEAKGHGVCGSAVEHGTRVIVEDVQNSPLFAGKPTLDVQLRAGVRAVQSTPLLTRSGKPVGVLSTHFRQPHRADERTLKWMDLLARQAADTIENAQVTTALRRSESRFRALTQAGWDVLYCMSPDWSQMCRLEGKGFLADTHEEAHDWLSRYIDPADQPQVAGAIGEAIRAKAAFDLEHRVRRADGSLGWVHSRAAPVLDSDGRIVEWFGAAKDVTESKRTETELFDQRQRLEALLQSLPVGVGFTDSPGCENVRCNAALLELFDAGPNDNVSASALDAQALGRRVVYLQEGRPVAADEMPLQRAAREGQRVGPLELEVRLPSGKRFFIDTTAAPIRNARAELIGAVVVAMDVAERRRAAQAREEVRLKDEFLSILGHELRNPLAAISNAMQALPHESSHAQRDEIDQLIGRQVGVLRRLVDDLLDVSRITHGLIRLQMDEISLAELLNSAAAAARPSARQRRQDLLVGLPPEDTRFVADKVRLRQILANLLDNATKYTDPGGLIELSAAREGSDVVLRCKDNGHGIAPRMQERIFEPLVRAHSAAPAAPGLGLGLTLVRRLAGLHGGSASVASAGPGAGSEFIVRIPFVAPQPAASQADQPAGVAAETAAASVVIVEDNADVAHSLALVLEQVGHRVSRFADGPAALAGIGSLNPDAVLIDIGLPGMSGYDVLARMRQQPHLARTLFIGSSGRPLAATGGSAAARFDHCLVKPVDIEALLALIDTHVFRPKPLVALLVEDHADVARATGLLLRQQGFAVEVAASAGHALEAARRLRPRIILCDLSLPDMNGLELIRELRPQLSAWGTHVVVVTGSSADELRPYNARAESLGVDQFVAKPITREWARRLRAQIARFEPAGTPAAAPAG